MEFLLGVAGIITSILLFLLGYRQTIGARKERIRSANAELEKILVRRVVLESYSPSISDIKRLIDGKSRDHRIRSSDLLPESQLLNNVFTRIFETDFISSQQREEVLHQLGPAFSEAERQPPNESELVQFGRERIAQQRFAAFMTITLAGFTSAVGIGVSVTPQLLTQSAFSEDLLPYVLGIGAASLAAIATIALALRFRERAQVSSSKGEEAIGALRFEQTIFSLLKRNRVPYQLATTNDRGFDLILLPESKKVPVEIKYWEKPVSSMQVTEALRTLMQATSDIDASEGLLLTPFEVSPVGLATTETSVSVLTPPRFRQYLSSLSSQA